jgi:predicted dienelactone hydrolase
MTLVDMLLIAALAIFVVAWWVRGLPGRAAVLAAAAVAALGLGVWGVIDDRWQDGVGACVALLLLAVLGVNRLRKAPAKTKPPIFSGSVFVLLLTVGIAAILFFPVSPLPKPSGPHPVGVRSFEVDDASRPGVLAAKPGEPRRLLVRVWYPAGDVSTLKPAPYFSEKEADTTAEGLGALVGFPPFFTFVKHVTTNSYPDAPLMAGPSRLPVVFYSHGYTSFLSQNTALMEHLASHGYIVFSVQHTYDSSATVFPDGDVAPMDPALAALGKAESEGDKAAAEVQKQALAGATLDQRLDGYLRLRELALGGTSDRLLKSGEVWAADRIFVHDQIQRGAVPPAIRQIAAAGDLTRVGEMGMSFGGATSGTVCMRDRRCAAGINLDGGDFPFQAFAAEMPVPFLMLHSDLANLFQQLKAEAPNTPRSFNEFSYEGFATAGTRKDLYRVYLKGARHLGLSDFSLFMRRPARDPIFGTTPTKVLIGAQNDFVLGFFDRHLRGVAGGFPAAELKRYDKWAAPVAVDGVRAWWAGKTPAEQAAIAARIEKARGSSSPPV